MGILFIAAASVQLYGLLKTVLIIGGVFIGLVVLILAIGLASEICEWIKAPPRPPRARE